MVGLIAEVAVAVDVSRAVGWAAAVETVEGATVGLSRGAAVPEGCGLGEGRWVPGEPVSAEGLTDAVGLACVCGVGEERWTAAIRPNGELLPRMS
jgi:hypothetical protein